MSDDITVPIYIDRHVPEAEKAQATAALSYFMAFRRARNKVLSASLGAALRAKMRADSPPGSDLTAAYDYVVGYLDWLVATGINSANPLRLERHKKRRP